MAGFYFFNIVVLIFSTVSNVVAAPKVRTISGIITGQEAESRYVTIKTKVSKGQGVDDPICGAECNPNLNQKYCSDIIPAIGLQLSDKHERSYGKCRGYTVTSGNRVFENQLMVACPIIVTNGRDTKYVSFGYTVFPGTYGFFAYDDIKEQVNTNVADANKAVRVTHYIEKVSIREIETKCTWCWP